MIPKLKAEELVLKFKELPQEGTLMFYVSFEIGKQCALIAVDEIINSVVIIDLTIAENQFIYWEEVKQEIILLQCKKQYGTDSSGVVSIKDSKI